MVNFDVITMGRIGVDIYPLQTGVSLREVTSFGKYMCGSATNVAVAAARYGRSVAVITRTGDDPFGEDLHDALKGFGVDDRWVTPVDGRDTPVAELEAALRDARASERMTVVHVETDPLVGAPSSEAWWDVPVAGIAELESTRAARADYERNKRTQHAYLSPHERVETP